jgi:alkylhydroperoxidase family enzyme
MPYGTLPPADTELVILRVAVLCGSDYEWYQHAGLAQRAGLSAEAVARVADGADASGWDERQRALLRATDELVERRTLTDATWEALRRHLSEAETIELSLLAGAYAMIAGVLNGCGVQPDPTGPLARMPGR